MSVWRTRRRHARNTCRGLQLELLAWTLRTDFLSFKADDEERDDWESLFYDAGTFFVDEGKTAPRLVTIPVAFPKEGE